MSEKNEKWFVLALIALAIWYFFKKAKTAAQGGPALPFNRVTNLLGGGPGGPGGGMDTTPMRIVSSDLVSALPMRITSRDPILFPFQPVDMGSGGPGGPGGGSVVNPTSEVYGATPFQTSTPVLFRPAQPSTVPVSQRVSVGPYDYSPLLANNFRYQRAV